MRRILFVYRMILGEMSTKVENKLRKVEAVPKFFLFKPNYYEKTCFQKFDI
jgi:hypothetical protein